MLSILYHNNKTAFKQFIESIGKCAWRNEKGDGSFVMSYRSFLDRRTEKTEQPLARDTPTERAYIFKGHFKKEASH